MLPSMNWYVPDGYCSFRTVRGKHLSKRALRRSSILAIPAEAAAADPPSEDLEAEAAQDDPGMNAVIFSSHALTRFPVSPSMQTEPFAGLRRICNCSLPAREGQKRGPGIQSRSYCELYLKAQALSMAASTFAVLVFIMTPTDARSSAGALRSQVCKSLWLLFVSPDYVRRFLEPCG